MLFNRQSSPDRTHRDLEQIHRELERIAKAMRAVNKRAELNPAVLAAQVEVERTDIDPLALDRSLVLLGIQGVAQGYAHVLAEIMQFPLARVSVSDAVGNAAKAKRK